MNKVQTSAPVSTGLSRRDRTSFTPARGSGKTQGASVAYNSFMDSDSAELVQRLFGNRSVAAFAQRQADSAAHGSDCGCAACTGIQRHASAETEREESLQLQRTSTDEAQHSHDASCGCSMCGVVQRVAEVNARSERTSARARTRQMHIPAYASDRAIQRKITRVQQRAPAAQGSHPLVQRHSSWEHMLIGELDKDELTLLGAAYDAQAAGPNGTVSIPNAAGGNRNIDITNVQHLIEQELRRLSHMMDTEPKIKRKDARDKGSKEINWAKAASAKRKEETRLNVAEGSGTWQVEFVLIPTVNGDLLPVTYGELNTLADFYGSVN